MSGWAKPGIRCACVFPGHNIWTGVNSEYIEVGAIYKIVSVNRFPKFKHLILLGIWGTPLDQYFDVECFRPLVGSSQSEDVATFQKIADHIDPITRADEFEREMVEGEARLAALMDALNRSDIP